VHSSATHPSQILCGFNHRWQQVSQTSHIVYVRPHSSVLLYMPQLRGVSQHVLLHSSMLPTASTMRILFALECLITTRIPWCWGWRWWGGLGSQLCRRLGCERRGGLGSRLWCRFGSRRRSVALGVFGAGVGRAIEWDWCGFGSRRRGRTFATDLASRERWKEARALGVLVARWALALQS
jgi:hypothetical protein